MSKLTIEADLEYPGATRVLLDGNPIGVIQLVRFEHASEDAVATCTLQIYDIKHPGQGTVLRQLEASSWIKVERIDPVTRKVKP